MKNTTFGNDRMHRQLVRFLRVVDVRVLYALVVFVIIPVCLLLNTNHSRTIAFRFYRKRLGYGILRAMWATYVNHCKFGQVVVDRFAAFAGRRFRVEIDGYEYYQNLTEQQDGFVQLSSHVGCYEVAGYTLTAKDKCCNALVYGGEKEGIMNGRKKVLDQNNIRMIPVQEDMSHLFLINEALSNHEIVSMPADRIIGSSKSLSVVFFGSKAHLPMGPFSVATMRGLNVISVNVLKKSTYVYAVHIKPLLYDKKTSRRDQMQQLATQYATELERVVRMYPTQWFNFYDFWA